MSDLNNIEKLVPALKQIERLRLERHEFIKSQLRLRQSSLAILGRQLGVGSATMTLVSKGLASSKRVRAKLAAAMGMEISELFPEIEIHQRNTEGTTMTT